MLHQATDAHALRHCKNKFPVRMFVRMAAGAARTTLLLVAAVSFAAGHGEQVACVDTPPPGSPHSCSLQREWGQCSEDWMLGYCEKTCRRGRCEGGSAGADAASALAPPGAGAWAHAVASAERAEAFLAAAPQGTQHYSAFDAAERTGSLDASVTPSFCAVLAWCPHAPGAQLGALGFSALAALHHLLSTVLSPSGYGARSPTAPPRPSRRLTHHAATDALRRPAPVACRGGAGDAARAAAAGRAGGGGAA